MKRKITLTYFEGARGTLKDEFNGYCAKRFFKDLWSGFAISLMILPIAMAVGLAVCGADKAQFGILAGAISAIIAGALSALLSGGPMQVSAPSLLTSAVLSKIASGPFGLEGMLVASFFVGLILIVCGFLKAGEIIKAIPRPVLCGIILGVSITVVISQLPALFCAEFQPSTDIFANVKSAFSNANTWIIVVSLISITIISIFPKKWNNVFPIHIALIAIISLIFYFSPLSALKIEKVSNSLMNSIKLDLDSISFAMIKSIALPVVEICLIIICQTLTCGKRMEEVTKKAYHPNIDIISQGAGAVISPFFGGIPSAPSYSASATALKCGATTRLSPLFSCLFMSLYVMLLPNVLVHIPLCAVSPVIVVAVIKLNDWKAIFTYFKKRSWDAVIALTSTTLLVVFTNIVIALAVGTLLSLIFMLFSLSTVDVYAELKKDLKTVGVTVTGPVFFGNIEEFIRKIKAINCDYERLIVNLGAVPYVDDTALDKMLEYFENLNREKVIYFVSCKVKVLKKIARLKFYKSFGEDKFLDSFKDAYEKSLPKKQSKTKNAPIEITLESKPNVVDNRPIDEVSTQETPTTVVEPLTENSANEEVAVTLEKPKKEVAVTAEKPKKAKSTSTKRKSTPKPKS